MPPDDAHLHIGVVIEEPDIEAAVVLGASPCPVQFYFSDSTFTFLRFALCRRNFYAHPTVLLLCSREREEEEKRKNQEKEECKVRFEENVQEDGQAEITRQAT